MHPFEQKDLLVKGFHLCVFLKGRRKHNLKNPWYTTIFKVKLGLWFSQPYNQMIIFTCIKIEILLCHI